VGSGSETVDYMVGQPHDCQTAKGDSKQINPLLNSDGSMPPIRDSASHFNKRKEPRPGGKESTKDR
jgi:hypothetical protein